MINVSNNYKQALTQPRTIDAKITYDSTTINIDDINSIKRSFNSTLFKTIAKQVIIDSNVSINKDVTINPQFGLYLDNQFEYVSLGSYKTKNAPNLNKDTNSYETTAYDKIVDSMVDYGLTNSNITYPCTVRQLFVAIFTKLGWSTSGIPSTFVNSSSMIEEDVYSNVNFTYRDVLDELCTISCMFLIDVNGTPTLKQKTTTSETINEDFMSDTNVKIKNQVFFNSLVFSRASNSDNIYRKDDTSIANNGLHEFKVSDLQILSLNWRDNFIDAMWNYIKTFTYYAYEVNTIGITYLEPIDTFTLSTFGSTYSTILLNSDLTISNGVNEKIYANEPLESETEYKYADTTDKRIKQTYLIVDKQQGQINAVVSQVDEIEQDLSSPTNTLTGEYFDLEDALDSPLIDFSLYGDTQQEENPTPSSPQEIHNVSGDNTIEICGKNLIPTSASDWEQGSITNGNNTSSTTRIRTIGYYKIANDTNYYISIQDATNYKFLNITFYDKNKTYINNYYNAISQNINGATSMAINIPNTTIPNIAYMRITIREKNDATITASAVETAKPQIEKGSTATEYEAYEGFSQEINLGKNLLNITPTTNSGVTGTYDSTTGALHVEGVARANYPRFTTQIPLNIPTNTTLTLSIQSVLTYKLYIRYYYDSSQYEDTFIEIGNKSVSYTLTHNCIKVEILGNIGTNNSVDDTLYIQLEKGSVATSFSVYREPIELNKISTYQDYIYKNNDKWFIHKENWIKIFKGGEDENWTTRTTTGGLILYEINVSGNDLYSTTTENIGYCNQYKAKQNLTDNNTFRIQNGSILGIHNQDITSLTNFKNELATNNLKIIFPLATSTDTEITDTTLLEQLDRLMTLPLYKNLTHITLTPNDLQPTMNIEYLRDTSINNNFVRQPQLQNYYTKSETIAQIQIGNASIQQSVVEVQTTLNNNNEAINTISNQVQNIQTSTSQQINIINEQLENGVEKVKTRTGFTFDEKGLDITKGEGFHSQITDRTLEVNSNNKELIFLGYDNNLKKTVARMDWIESEHATIGVHRTETITKNGQKRTAGFYVGGGN